MGRVSYLLICTLLVARFHKVLPSYTHRYHTPTGDDIELRVCSDQSTRADDTPISLFEIYIIAQPSIKKINLINY